MKTRRFLYALALCCILALMLPITVAAASYSTDYRYWSQGASSNTNMNNYGCWVVAQAKLIYEANIDRSSSFNPDAYMEWEQENGYLNSGFYQVNGTYAPVAYANAKGKSLSYLGSTTSSVESKIWDNIDKGYWSLIYVKTSSGGDHYVMIANELSKTNGKLYCYNSFVGYSSASPSSIETRGYTIKSVYTYSASTADSVSVSHGYTGYTDTITDTNAIVYGTVSKASSDSTSKFGIYIQRTDSTYDNGWSYVHDASSSWIGQTSVRIWYDINDEVGLTLTHATSYTYKLYAVVNGKEYYSPEKTFTTTGSHSYGSWSTVKAATCTASGSQKRSCSCGAVETQTVAALGHNYSTSYTVDQAATCTASGSKSKHCSRCSAKSDVTTIPATGHSYGAWVTESVVSCTEDGVQKRTCSTCQHVETETTAALGHDFAEEYTVDQAATCTESGSKSRHCSRCSAKSDVTTVPATGHSYSDWQILTEATLQKEGSRTKACACGDSVTEAIPQLVGKVKEWNVALGDDLTVNFYLEVSDSIMSTAKVQLIQENSSQTTKVSGLKKTEDGLYKISVHMAATQMNDTITVMVKNGSDKAPSADYSIRQYCDTLLADESQTAYHALIKEMLNYGAAAQAFFGYESDGAANEGITGAGQTAVPERAPEMSVSGTAGSVRFYGASLVYESKIAVRFYFSGDVSGCRFTVGEQTYTPVAKNGLYYIEVSDILPQNLDETIAVTVASGEEILRVSYSPLTYIVRMNAKGSESLQALMRALYNYHLAAKALKTA